MRISEILKPVILVMIRVMHGENLRKFTETRVRAPRARHVHWFCRGQEHSVPGTLESVDISLVGTKYCVRVQSVPTAALNLVAGTPVFFLN